MQIADLPEGWMATRSSMHAYAQALSALPRAAAAHDDRWRHVSLDPTERGFVTYPTIIGNDVVMTGELDLVDHRVTASAGAESLEIDLRSGPSPHSVGSALVELAAKAGGNVEPDADRFADDSAHTYDPSHAIAFRNSAVAVVEAMNVLNSTLDGEITGPHLWPHGFDIATEWYSGKTVQHDGSEASAHIMAGWYPSDSSYVYVIPWPFDDSWTDETLPFGATWNVEGWQGAKLDVPSDGYLEPATLTGLARAVHQLTAMHLSP